MTETNSTACVPRPAWNKGKITGPKPPLRPGHVWAIRAKLDLQKRTRDLAMFSGRKQLQQRRGRPPTRSPLLRVRGSSAG
jgi:hypothetical protein